MANLQYYIVAEVMYPTDINIDYYLLFYIKNNLRINVINNVPRLIIKRVN